MAQTARDEPGRTAGSALVVVPGLSDIPSWARRLRDARIVTGERALDEQTSDAEVGIVDSRLEAPLAVARRLRRAIPALQLILVAEPDRGRELQRSMLFTPGLGEPWIVRPEAVDQDLVERAREVTRRRRSHTRRLADLAGPTIPSGRLERRTRRLSDQYLATLLELLPEPVFALDEQDRVLFANPVAHARFAEDDMTGVDLREILAPLDGSGLEELLGREGSEPVRKRLALRALDGSERIYHATSAPVRSERPVRALLLHDVTDEVRSRAALEAQARDLEMALRHRSRFYASMSHELRTPINAIVGYTRLILEGVYGEDPDAHRTALERIDRAARHLLDLVNDVLDLAKIESGKVSVRIESVRLSSLILDLEATMEPLARDHGVELRFDLAEDCDRPIATDPRRVRQILMNLLSNAIRYGGGQPVEVTCARDSGVRIAVRDRGPGIDPERIEEIFEEFVQLHGDEPGGTGLGLPIARTLARSLGGDVTVETSGPGGSVFSLTLPEDPPAPDTSEAATAVDP
jgi:PAS domain S-box-containing protein